MIEKKEFYFPSSNGINQIHCIEWIPEQPIRAVFQIVHGMTEYLDRYDGFARFLAEKGYYVVGHDHQGHGKSVDTLTQWGYFDKRKPAVSVLNDIVTLQMQTKKRFSEVPYLILGHSMGSFFIRRFACLYGDRVDGVIVSGTGNQKPALLIAAKAVNTVISTVFGYVHRSPFFARMMFGENNKRISNLKTPYDWLTKDEAIVKKYSEDPACTFLFTGNGIKGLMDTVTYVIKQKHVNLTPVDLPMFFIAGKEDPVGEYGEAVKRAFAMYEAHQMKHISLKLYETDRHEILNETDREQVYQDIYQWSEGVINR